MCVVCIVCVICNSVPGVCCVLGCVCVVCGYIGFVEVLLFCASRNWVMWGGWWKGSVCMGVGCASKRCFRGVLHGFVCGGVVTMSCVVWWFPVWGCGLLSTGVCGDVCVVCDLLGCGVWPVLHIRCVMCVGEFIGVLWMAEM